MKLVIQRVKQASVRVNEQVVGSIEHGLLCYVGFTHDDTFEVIDKAVSKVLKLRIFNDQNNMMNVDVKQIKGSVLVVSQFTLYGDAKSSNRPSWMHAAKQEQAKHLYDAFVQKMSVDIHTESGQFGSHMDVTYTNDGPVTILLELEG